MFKIMTKLYDDFSKSHINKFSYIDELTRFVCSIFKYENLPEDLDARFLEFYLNLFGSVVVGKLENTDKIICVPASLSGEIDQYGLGTEAFGICPIGEVRGIRNETVVYGRNNKTAIPTYSIYRNAEMLTELDKSIMCCIINSRLHPIPNAKDNLTKQSLDEALKAIREGDIASIMSENVFKNDELDTSIDVLNLTDVSASDKIQYLFHSKDDVYRQFYNHFGQSAQGTSKMAQQTVNEIEDGVSMVDVLDMLEERKEMVENINRIFDTNITVELAEPWAIERAKTQQIEAQNMEGDGEDEEITTNNESIE